MNEPDYLKATNRAKVGAAIKILTDVLPGDEYGITEEEYKEFMEPLCVAQENLFKSFKLSESQKSANCHDADRYRYLRNRDLDTISRGGVFAGLTPDNLVLNGIDLDKEIDTQMKREQKKIDSKDDLVTAMRAR